MITNKTHETEGLSKLGDLKILLPGVPCRSSRGWFGYCTVILFPLKNEWALFDTGHQSDRSQLLAALAAAQIEPREIKHVVLSHLHFDHALNLPLFKNASVTLAESELDYARQVSAGKVEDPSIPDFWSELLANHKVNAVEDTLEIDEDIKLVNLPGHTPGCLVMFYEGPATVAVCGDVIKNGWEIMSGESTSPGANDIQTQANIKFVKEMAQVIIPGHDRPLMVCRDGLKYLNDFQWQIIGNFFPRPREERLLDLKMAAGIKKQEPA
jgi:glyoxylase-like metal-dependent hydrolase (beta-lactamase superfamily II)